MDKRTLAELVRESTAPGESQKDFSRMVNTLVAMQHRPTFVRGPTGRLVTPNIPRAAYAINRAWFLCLFLKPKPPEYIEAMHQFRMAFAGIAEDHRLEGIFKASIRPRLLMVTKLDAQLLRPSNFFDLNRAIESATDANVKFNRPPAWY
jgi:hypothetical protein